MACITLNEPINALSAIYWTQERVCEAIGISRPTFDRWSKDNGYETFADLRAAMAWKVLKLLQHYEEIREDYGFYAVWNAKQDIKRKEVPTLDDYLRKIIERE